VAVSFIGGEKPEYPEKTTNLLQVTDKLVRIVLLSMYLLSTEKLNTVFGLLTNSAENYV